MNVKKWVRDKKGIEMETLVWIIVAVVILAVMIIGFIIMRDKDMGIVEFIKNMFRFGK
jgi:hypothetical protein